MTSRMTKKFNNTQKRKNAYDLVNSIYKQVKDAIIDYEANNTYYYRMLAFLTSIKKANFKLAMIFHKKLIEYEEKMIDFVVFSQTDKITSEDTRLLCLSVKNYSDIRKKILLIIMKLDAQIGYWKLSK